MTMGKKTATLETTKEAKDLKADAQGVANAIRGLNLPCLSMKTLGDKDLKPFGDAMTAKKASVLWMATVDFNSFSFELELKIGSQSISVATAKMNGVDMDKRKPILDHLRAAKVIAQSDEDAYFKEAAKRAESSA